MTRNLIPILTLALTFTALPAAAQDADGSGRAVARLSLLTGDISVRKGDTGDLVAAAINAPLFTEDQVLSGPGARAEVQLDYSNFARLSENAELRLADIENNRYLLRLAQGTMTYRVLRSEGGQAEISTPSIAIRPLKKGIYRISVLPDGTTEVTVRNGEAEIYTPRGSQKLKSGRTLMARGSSNDPEFQAVNAGMIDDWDRWNENRDRQLDRSQSYDYVSRDITGAEDLDGHGRWVNTPEYGNVWVPNTSAGWAPYRHGRWSWVDYYGWNWISYDPWGWAPYHYGRWFHRPSIGWCWWPGRISARHYWSPALVGFFGWGRGGFNVGIGVGFGNWGWVPLAPYETYYPWYGRGYYGGFRNRNVINNVTVINNTNITNIYRNARVDNSITSVNGRDFGRGSVNHVRVDRAALSDASVMRGQLPMVPDANSMRMSDRESRVAAGRGTSRGSDAFVASRQPSRVDRVPFETQRAAMQESSRRAFGDNSGSGRGGEVAAGRGSDTSVGRGSDNGGFRRAGESPAGRGETFAGRGADSGASVRGSDSSGRGADAGTSVRGGDNGGWRRFGDSSGSAGASVSRGGDSGGRGVDAGASTRGSDSGSWRRFGDTSADTGSSRGGATFGRGADNGSSTRGADSGSWRRFGDSSTDSGSSRGGATFGRGSDSGASTRGSDSGSWRRFGDSSADSGSSRGGSTFGRGSDSGATVRGNSGSFGRGSDSGASTRSNGGFFGRGSGDSSNRGSSAPRMSAPSGSSGRGSFGGFGRSSRSDSGGSVIRSAPSSGGGFGRGGSSSSSPRMSAPSSGRSSGGSFGGGMRSGGGGGGSRSSSSGGGGSRGGGGGSRGGGGRGR